jgi:hypothetical protein
VQQRTLPKIPGQHIEIDLKLALAHEYLTAP